MTTQEIGELLDLMATKGAVHLKSEAIELHLSPLFLRPTIPTDAVPKTEAIGAESGYPTEEELLMLSTPYALDIKAKPPEEL